MRNFLESLRESGALKWLLVWGVVILVVVLAIHFFSKSGQSSASTAASDAAAVPPNSVKNVTILNNGYPASASAGSAGATGTTPMPGPMPGPGGVPPTSRLPPVIAPGAGSRPTQVKTVVLPSNMTWSQIAAKYAGSGANANWVLSWNNQLKSKPWWTVDKGTKVNIPYN